jgi:hypothetical protein
VIRPLKAFELISIAVSVAFVASCAPRMVALPSGTGASFPEYATAYGQATDRCRDVKTMAAVLSISGRAGRQRFRAKIDAGFAAPARIRLELPAPGKPIFTFVATGDDATLVFPRDARVLRGAPASATLEALAGVPIGPQDLGAILAGCSFSSNAPTSGRAFPGGWAAVDAGNATKWLQQVDGSWRLVAASRGPVEVRYADFAGGRPSTIRLRTSPEAGQPASDLTIRLSQVDVNEPLGDEVFQVDVPSDARPMTLEELRQAGPLGR